LSCFLSLSVAQRWELAISEIDSKLAQLGQISWTYTPCFYCSMIQLFRLFLVCSLSVKNLTEISVVLFAAFVSFSQALFS